MPRSHRTTKVHSLALAALAALCALSVPAPSPADQIEYPPAQLKRSFDGIFSSLIPDTPSPNQVIIRNGSIPGRVYGGSAKGEGTVSGNSVVVLGGSIARGVAAGFNSPSENPTDCKDGQQTGRAISNAILVLGGTVSGAVAGWSNGPALGNTVTVAGGSITGTLAGGLAYAQASGNQVFLSGGQIKTNAVGAIARKGLADGNHVTISEGADASAVTGGIGESGAMGNSVLVIGGTLKGDATGGASQQGTAGGNQIILHGGQIGGSILGGHSSERAASHNNIFLVPAPGGTPIVCQGDISGGQSDKGTAEHNGVRMGSGMVYGSLFGARGSDRASSNHVDVESGTVQGEVTGGEGTSQAVDNTVRLSGGSVQDVTGGRVTDREHVLGHVNQIFGQDPEENEEPQDSSGTQKLASRNQVIISGGSVFGSVTGGISESGSATDNTIVISENATLSDSTVLSGGDAPTTFSGNVLEVSGAIMANSIRNFETIRFASPAMEGGCLILSGKAVLSAKGQTAKIVVPQIASDVKLPESFVLIHAEDGIDLGGGSFTKKQPGVRHGSSSVTLLYSLSRDGKDLIATVDTGHGTKK